MILVFLSEDLENRVAINWNLKKKLYKYLSLKGNTELRLRHTKCKVPISIPEKIFST